MGTISLTIIYAVTASQGQTRKLFMPICKLQRKWSFLKTTLWVCIHNTYFIPNLHIGPISLSVTLHKAKSLSSDKHSSLLEALESYEENEVLWTQPLMFRIQHQIYSLLTPRFETTIQWNIFCWTEYWQLG